MNTEWLAQDAAEIAKSIKAGGSSGIALGTNDIEGFLSLQLVSILDMQPDDPRAERYEGRIVGWRRNSMIVWQTDLDPKKRWRIANDCESVLRFFSDGRAFALKTHVYDWHVHGSQRFVFMTWPRESKYRVLRQFKRVSTELLCETQTKMKDTLWGTLLQLSETGARVSLPINNAADVPARISFELPNRSAIESLSCTVKHASRIDGGIVFGCTTKTEELPIEQRFAILDFITLRLCMRSPYREAEATVVVLDQNPDQHDDLVRAVQDRLGRIVVLQNVFSCFAWLHAQGSVAIYINADHRSMVPEEIVQVIRRSPYLGSVPVYLFGGVASEGAARAESCGAKYLPKLEPTSEGVENVMLHIKPDGSAQS